MIEKFAGVCGVVLSEFLDLNHTSKPMILVSLMIPKFARDASCEVRRTSESGHWVMLGVGILGAGFFGAVHARAIASTPGVRLTAVCAEEADLAQAFAAEYGGKAYSNWRQFSR